MNSTACEAREPIAEYQHKEVPKPKRGEFTQVIQSIAPVPLHTGQFSGPSSGIKIEHQI